MKKKNIKIKHRKYSLYQRKKSKGRLRPGQATGGVLL